MRACCYPMLWWYCISYHCRRRVPALYVPENLKGNAPIVSATAPVPTTQWMARQGKARHDKNSHRYFAKISSAGWMHTLLDVFSKRVTLLLGCLAPWATQMWVGSASTTHFGTATKVAQLLGIYQSLKLPVTTSTCLLVTVNQLGVNCTHNLKSA
jgi:hypothetical protein